MGGGLMQLVAYGAQDIYLTGNPQITFFKVVYRRHTNFSMEAIQQTFSGTADFGADVTATISRNGDLVYRMYLEHELTTNASQEVSMVANYGSRLMKECELEIGGQKIDKHSGAWLEVNAELTQNTTGAGLFDKEVVNDLKKLEDPYPYFRGLVTELGYDVSFMEFEQPKRFSGKTKNENNKKYVNLREISEIPKKAVDTSKGTPIKGGCGNVFPPK